MWHVLLDSSPLVGTRVEYKAPNISFVHLLFSGPNPIPDGDEPVDKPVDKPANKTTERIGERRILLLSSQLLVTNSHKLRSLCNLVKPNFSYIRSEQFSKQNTIILEHFPEHFVPEFR